MSWFRFKPLRVLEISTRSYSTGEYPNRVVTDRGTYARTYGDGPWSCVDDQREATMRETEALRAICRDWETSRKTEEPQ